MATGDAVAVVGLLLLVGVVVGWFALWRRGLTPGKWAMGIRVAKVDGQQPGILTMAFREWIAKYVSGFLFGLGWLWAVWDRDQQAWHDKIAGTIVLRWNSVQPAPGVNTPVGG